jgi:hypothetical protein
MKAPITDRPILFSAPMVRALLAGTKTQTRRTVKRENAPSPGYSWAECMCAEIDPADVPCVVCDSRFGACPYGEAGDALWVRETHALVPRTAYAQSEGVQQTANPADPDQAAVYREGWERSAPGKWRPSIHMPRWASRITLRVTSVRVERVQDLSEEDAGAEGIQSTRLPLATATGTTVYHAGDWPTPVCGDSARAAFARLWESINGAESWEANPWVWVVGFERVESAVLAQIGRAS